MKKILLILLLCTIAVVPFLGTFDYNTKGEPREAIVSLTMVESGNWIIPRNDCCRFQHQWQSDGIYLAYSLGGGIYSAYRHYLYFLASAQR